MVGSPAEILSQPLSVKACEGATVDFVVSASSQSGELGYQWQFYNTSDEIWNNLDDNDNMSFTRSSLPKVNNFGKLVTERIKGFLKDDDLTEFKDEN